MGLVSGGLNGRRFRITTSLPADFRDAWLEAVRTGAFVPVPDAADAEPRSGWVDVFDAANNRFELNTFLYDRYVVLSLRSDKKAVNGRYFKIALAERFAAVMEMRGVEKLSKEEKAEIEEALSTELHARALPSVSTTDVVWDIHSGEVIVFATSDAVLERIVAHFEGTFDVRLRPERQCDWVAEKYEWKEIIERVEKHVPDARGGYGTAGFQDGYRVDDPFEGADVPLAADFLTWLWLQSESADGHFRVIEGVRDTVVEEHADEMWNDVTESLKNADVTLWLESKLKLQDIEALETPDTQILLGVAPSTTPAARRGLSSGKRPVEAQLGMKLNDLEVGMSLSATGAGLVVGGLKLPFEVKSGQEEKIFERMLLLDLVHSTVKKLYQQFFLDRTSDAWAPKVDSWLNDADLAAK
ncbi:MAG: recombination-associated protein RdgC [Alphaproteobacteria bacterium]|nr:recombination-associated protein RdgC [Alphaproteobacteria bacterium]